MFRKFRTLYPLAVALLLSTAIVAAAQDAICPAIVQTALAATDEACAETGRNQACYGNINLEAEPQEGIEAFEFTAPGDLVDVAGVQTLRLSPLDEETNVWGVALLKLQANLPDTLPGQNVTFLLFGDVEIQNAVPSNVEGVTSPEIPQFPPMQAFYFKTGANDAPCAEAPDSGILIQTPAGAGKIQLTMNGADVLLGSTAYIQAQPGGEMSIILLEGEAEVQAQGESVTVPAGTYTTLEVDADLNVSGAPAEAQPYDPQALAALPVSLLERPVTMGAEAEATPDPSSTAGGLNPVPGTWTSVFSNLATEGCPAIVTEALQSAPVQDSALGSTFTIPEGEFTLEAVYAANAFEVMDGMTLSNPEPGVHVIDFNIEGATSRFEIRVISPTHMEGVMVASAEGCTIHYTFVMDAIE